MYKIIKFKFNGKNRVIKTGLSLEEAKEYCNREDTRGEEFFCGYEEE